MSLRRSDFSRYTLSLHRYTLSLRAPCVRLGFEWWVARGRWRGGFVDLDEEGLRVAGDEADVLAAAELDVVAGEDGRVDGVGLSGGWHTGEGEGARHRGRGGGRGGRWGRQQGWCWGCVVVHAEQLGHLKS